MIFNRQSAFVVNECVGVIGRWSGAFIVLFSIAASLTLHAQSGFAMRRADAQPFTKDGRYLLQSSPRVNLHQRPLYEARFKQSPLAALSANDHAKCLGGDFNHT